MTGLIVYAFPGTGKTNLASKDKRFIDLESSNYRWVDKNVGLNKREIEKRKGSGEPNPNFLMDYKADIIKYFNDGKIVLIAYDLVDELIRDGYRVIQVFPNPSEREIYYKRYIDRGNTTEWANKIVGILDFYIENGYPYKDTYILKNGEFLKDFFKKYMGNEETRK